jgi:SAM-dependent methyltransferase
LTTFTWPVTLRMLIEARLKPGMRVLDVGCGTGDTALAAAMAVGVSGEVVGCDLAEAMLATARDRARAYGLTQVRFEAVAMEAVAAEAASFDAILGRFSLIFCPDVSGALAHLGGFLRSGGRVVMASWAAPAVNPAFAIPSQALRAVIDAPPPDPSMPGPFRLSDDGALSAVFSDAGFAEVTVTEVPCYQFGSSAEAYWEMLSAMSGSFCKQYRGLSPPQQEAVKRHFLEAIRGHTTGGVLRVPALALVGAATGK